LRGCSRNKNQEDMIYLPDIIVVIWNEFRMTRWYLITFLYDCIPGILSFLSAFCSIRYTHAKSFFCIYHSSSSLLVHSFFVLITWTNKLENDFFFRELFRHFHILNHMPSIFSSILSHSTSIVLSVFPSFSFSPCNDYQFVQVFLLFSALLLFSAHPL